MTLRFYTTVGILNVLYLKEFFDFIRQYDMQVLLNLVHYPHHYAIVNLPNDVKDVIKDKLLSIQVENLLAEWSPSIDNIINFMYGSDYNKELLKTFFDKTRLHDGYRKDSFNDTFIELYKLLKDYE